MQRMSIITTDRRHCCRRLFRHLSGIRVTPSGFDKSAEFLSTINLSQGFEMGVSAQDAAAPTGRSTRVIITEYDLPRKCRSRTT